MQHEISETRTEVQDTNLTFDSIYAKPYIPQNYIDDIKNADILVIPEEDCKEQGDFLFPETTTDFLNYLRDNLPSELSVDIAVSDEEYNKLELHSASIILATVVIKKHAVEVVIGMISAFLYDLCKKLLRKPEDLSTKVKIISEETKTKKSKMITYEGPVSGIKDALEQASKDLFKD